MSRQTRGPEDMSLDVLHHMMRDPNLDSDERIGIAKICLPFDHPRIAQVDPPEPEAEAEPKAAPVDTCDPNYLRSLIRVLIDSLRESADKGREIPHFVWHSIKYIPRNPDDLKKPVWERLKGFTD